MPWLRLLMLSAALAVPAHAAEPPRLLTQIHHAVMAEARYVPDAPGRDIWRASTIGDCEDLALEMARRLEGAGIAPEAMRIVVDWNRAHRTWHAALLVDVRGGRWRLDSLEPQPLPWNGAGIEWEVGAQGRRIVAINGRAVRDTAWRE